MELIAELFAYLFDLVLPSASGDDIEQIDRPRRSFGQMVRVVSVVVLGMAFVGLIVAIPILWATASVEGMTLIGLTVAALIAGRLSYLLGRRRDGTTQ